MPPHDREDSHDRYRDVPKEAAATWNQVVDAVTRTQDTQGMVLYYRGQSCADWVLTPSLVRLFGELDLKGPAAIQVERDSLSDFKRRARLWLRSELLPREDASAVV